jgi:hypothetical protein
VRVGEIRRGRLVRGAFLLGVTGYVVVRVATRERPEEAVEAPVEAPAVVEVAPARVETRTRWTRRYLVAVAAAAVFFAAAAISAGARIVGDGDPVEHAPVARTRTSATVPRDALVGLAARSWRPPAALVPWHRPHWKTPEWWRYYRDGWKSKHVWHSRKPPTPPAPPLAFATAAPPGQAVLARLQSTAGARKADWALVLADLRTASGDQAVSIPAAQLGDLERRLAGAGLTPVSDPALGRTLAYARYFRAIGPDAVAGGLDTAKTELEQKILGDSRLQIYPGGRGDIESGRVDVRVLAALEYLAETYGEVTVSCLITGHTRFARPGVVSAHIFGRAADVAALGGVPILDHQQPGGLTEQAVRQLLLLPPEDLPTQVISLLALGGPSFAQKDHYDHIHIGY